MTDHFYTTDPNGELAMNGGYWLEGKACHVFPNQVAIHVGFFRWYNPNTGDHFYCQDPNGELAKSSGYTFEGKECSVFRTQEPNTVPLFRWFNSINGDHFYTQDPNGELAAASGYDFEGTACYVYQSQQPNSIPLFRWYNSNNGDHFYCLDPNGEGAAALGYISEGISGYVLASNFSQNLKEFYRWVNPNNGDHFYTIDPTGELAPTIGYISEGVACYVFANPAPNTVPLFRWYNPNTGDHFYCLDPNGELAPTSGYVPEGIACNVFANHRSNTVPLFRWFNSGGCRQKITVHFKSLLPITDSIRDFWINQFSGMAELYMSGGISVKLGSIEDLSADTSLLPLRNLRVGGCDGIFTTPQQLTLFSHRNNAATDDIVVYFVSTLVNTLGLMAPNFLAGCAAFPAFQPGCVIVLVGEDVKWLVAHEVGHVLGLLHVCDNIITSCMGRSGSLMFPSTAWTSPPPDLSSAEFNTMFASFLSVNC
jgi:hypothetical protein